MRVRVRGTFRGREEGQRLAWPESLMCICMCIGMYICMCIGMAREPLLWVGGGTHLPEFRERP